jgi:Ser/Thr protein kinase RdoA (MazF antagonist)
MELEPAAASLLASIGQDTKNLELQPLSASGNNRVFAVKSFNQKFVLKWYFHDHSDQRDRLGAEYSFLEHAWKMGLRCIPQPFAKDPTQHIALYEFVEGNKLNVEDVSQTHIDQAAQFLADLNSKESHQLAQDLPIASEACFSLTEHVDMVEKRLDRLKVLVGSSAVDLEAIQFIQALRAIWARLCQLLSRAMLKVGVNLDLALNQNQRCISPSDFGFHNALLRDNETLCFIDFEYAGWDDPAKAIGDFFAHPGVQISHQYLDSFLEKALAPYNESFDDMNKRVRLLEPLFQIKWCCIILNEFLPNEARRRNFANPTSDNEGRKQMQLAKAKKLFESIIF